MASINSFDDRTTSDLLQLVRDYRAGRLGGSASSGDGVITSPSGILFMNQTNPEETIPPYACMRMFIEGGQSRNGRFYINVQKPDSGFDDSLVFFNGPNPVPPFEYGFVQDSIVINALTDIPATTDVLEFGVEPGQWFLKQKLGAFKAIGASGLGTNVLKVVRNTSALYRFTLTTDFVNGTANASVSSLTTNQTFDVLLGSGDIFDELDAGSNGLCIRSTRGRFTAIQANCPL